MRIKIIVIFAVLTFMVIPAGHGIEELSDYIYDSQMSWKEAVETVDPGCPESIINNLTLMEVVYYGMEGRVHWGQIVVDSRLVSDLQKIFDLAYIIKFPFESVVPVSAFDWDDHASMAANNTSGFNYRKTTGGAELSNHAYGFAVDINPRLNPYVKGELVLPSGAVYDPAVPGTLTADHAIVRKFIELGWTWGGNWESLKDYQHFEKAPE